MKFTSSTKNGNRPTLNFNEIGMDEIEYEIKNKVFLSPRLLGHASGCFKCDVCKMRKKFNDEKERIEKQLLEQANDD
jgi:hypothetical protein